MRKIFLTALVPCLLAAACAVQPDRSLDDGEGASQATTALQPTGPILLETVTGTKVSATDTIVSVTYVRSVTSTGAYSVVLTGPGGTTRTVTETSLGGGRYGASFPALSSCAAYAYAVVSPIAGHVADGAIHTRNAGNTACLTGETLAPTKTFLFEGLWHERFDHDYCTSDSWDPNLRMYPEGAAWREVEWPGNVPAAKYGYRHTFNPGKDPLPCPEAFVEARRARFDFDLTTDQMRRVTDAKFVASYQNLAGTGACTSDVEDLVVTAWPVGVGQANNLNDFGAGWSSVLGGPVTNNGLDVLYNGSGTGMIASGGMLIADWWKPKSSKLVAGLWAYHDGFGSPSGPFEQNNNACMVSVSNVGMKLAYDLPPDTPLNCSWSLDCNTPTVTCDGAGDVFAFTVALTDGTEREVATFDDSATPGAPVTVQLPPASGAIKSVTVCTVAGGARACTAPMTQPTRAVACLPTCTSALTCPGDAVVPPTRQVTCTGPTDFYLQVAGGVARPLGTSTSMRQMTSTYAGDVLTACMPGTNRCVAYGVYAPRADWCTASTPPPPPPCDAAACMDSCRTCNGSRGTCSANRCTCASHATCE